MAFIRMDGARILSIKSVQRKAMTAATTGGLDPSVETKLALATDCDMVNLKGGARGQFTVLAHCRVAAASCVGIRLQQVVFIGM